MSKIEGFISKHVNPVKHLISMIGNIYVNNLKINITQFTNVTG